MEILSFNCTTNIAQIIVFTDKSDLFIDLSKICPLRADDFDNVRSVILANHEILVLWRRHKH